MGFSVVVFIAVCFVLLVLLLAPLHGILSGDGELFALVILPFFACFAGVW
nr:hypothetical protein [Enterococcus faecium]